MTQNGTQFMITADVQCFTQNEFPGCSETHQKTWEALNKILKETFERQSISSEGVTCEWRDGGGHACISYKVPLLNPSEQDGLVQTFADVVETCKAADDALLHLKNADVFHKTEENGKMQLSIASPDDNKFGGTLVPPTPSAD